MRFPSDLVPQKAVADDLCVSVVTLWRARRSGIPDFPEPVIIRNMIFWRKVDVQRLEDALMRFEGRGKFESQRVHAKRQAAMEKVLTKSKKPARRRKNDERQLALF